jgi:hypothetical protein
MTAVNVHRIKTSDDHKVLSETRFLLGAGRSSLATNHSRDDNGNLHPHT